MLTKGPAGNGRPSQEVASSGVTRPPRHHEETSFPDGRWSALGWLSSRPVGLGFSCSTGSRNGAARRNSPATTETRRVCRSPRSLAGWDAQKQPSRHTCTTRLMLTKGLRIAPCANASPGATRAVYGAPAHKAAPGLSESRAPGQLPPATRQKTLRLPGELEYHCSRTTM